MIEFIRQILPYLFILFFLVKGLKHPIYFLGILFLIFMSESIFFENVGLFKIPGRFGTARMLMWMIIFWILPILVRIYSDENVGFILRRLNILDYFIIGLMLISLLGLIIVLVEYSKITGVFVEFFTLLSLFAGYLIIKFWSSHYQPEVLKDFLFSLVIINTIASVLYILHQGLGIKIYQLPEYSEEYIQGATITRTFWFMPQFLIFSVAFTLVFRKKGSFLLTVLLIINLLAIFITYTRSALINAVIIFILYSILVGLKKRRLVLVLKNVLIYCLMAIFGLVILSKALPTSTQFFMSRFDELSSSSKSFQPNNLEYRFIMTGYVISNIDQNKIVFGEGPVTVTQSATVPAMKLATSDMVWTGVIFRWGFTGLILFILLYVFSIVISFNLYMKSEGIISDFALMLLLYIISQIIESFVSWTFMSGHGFATGLWYFAMLSALIGLNKKTGIIV